VPFQHRGTVLVVRQGGPFPSPVPQPQIVQQLRSVEPPRETELGVGCRQVVRLHNAVGARRHSQPAAIDTQLLPWRQRYRQGQFKRSRNALLAKFFTLKERPRLRVNLGVVNVPSVQRPNTPGADRTVAPQKTYGGLGARPQQVQVTARLEW